MGFGDFLKNVGVAALEGAQKFGEKNLEYQEKWSEQYSRMSDEQLKREHERFRKGGWISSQEGINRMSCLMEEMRNSFFRL